MAIVLGTGPLQLLYLTPAHIDPQHTLPLQRTLLRNNTPGNKAIGVHYDQIFLRHGEPTSVTAWVPIGDVGIQGGGLIYMEKGTEQLICQSETAVIDALSRT